MGRPQKNDPWENRFQSWKAEKKEKEEAKIRDEERKRQSELSKTLKKIENDVEQSEIQLMDDFSGKPRTQLDRKAAILIGVGIIIIVFVVLTFFNYSMVSGWFRNLF